MHRDPFGGGWHGGGSDVPAESDIARHESARPLRSRRTRSAQTQSAYAPYTGARDIRGGLRPRSAGHGRSWLRPEAGEAGTADRGAAASGREVLPESAQ